jgi:hypothetical protein
LRENFFPTQLVTKQGLVTKQLFVSERLRFDVKGILSQNSILFQTVSHVTNDDDEQRNGQKQGKVAPLIQCKAVHQIPQRESVASAPPESGIAFLAVLTNREASSLGVITNSSLVSVFFHGWICVPLISYRVFHEIDMHTRMSKSNDRLMYETHGESWGERKTIGDRGF